MDVAEAQGKTVDASSSRKNWDSRYSLSLLIATHMKVFEAIDRALKERQQLNFDYLLKMSQHRQRSLQKLLALMPPKGIDNILLPGLRQN